MDEQAKKIEEKEKEFIKPEPKKKEPIITDKEIEEKLDTNFDEDSLLVYGSLLSEAMDISKPGKESA